MGRVFSDFENAIRASYIDLGITGARVDAGRWQGIPTEGKPDLITQEMLNLQFAVDCDRPEWHNGAMQDYLERLQQEIEPNLPWADEHFAERVGGVPMNPDPSHERWPWWRGQDAETKDGGKFTHTYSERFWPRYAGEGDDGPYRTFEGRDNRGIRYGYGEYDDVLDLLAEDPYTRQAYLPIFFPEDTGAVHRGRIPCSLGYHFLLRDGRLHMWYDIRSCDAVRHFRDDLYLAARLIAHTIEQLQGRETMPGYQDHHDYTDPPAENWLWSDVSPGLLFFSCHSFHVHMGDYHLMRREHE